MRSHCVVYILLHRVYCRSLWYRQEYRKKETNKKYFSRKCISSIYYGVVPMYQVTTQIAKQFDCLQPHRHA